MAKFSKRALIAQEVGGLDYLKSELKNQLKNLKGKRYNRKGFEPYAMVLIGYLKKKYQKELSINGYTDPTNISISFKRATMSTFCEQDTGFIQIGFDILIAPKKIGYRREAKWQKKWCTKNIDFANWLILHEFGHLWKGYPKHDYKFFSLIDRIATENSWIFN